MNRFRIVSLAVFALLAVPRPARADCRTDADCPESLSMDPFEQEAPPRCVDDNAHPGRKVCLGIHWKQPRLNLPATGSAPLAARTPDALAYLTAKQRLSTAGSLRLAGGLIWVGALAADVGFAVALTYGQSSTTTLPLSLLMVGLLVTELGGPLAALGGDFARSGLTDLGLESPVAALATGGWVCFGFGTAFNALAIALTFAAFNGQGFGSVFALIGALLFGTCGTVMNAVATLLLESESAEAEARLEQAVAQAPLSPQASISDQRPPGMHVGFVF